MATLAGYAKRCAKLREAMEATLETWREEEEENENLSPNKRERIEERNYRLEEAISTLESLESELEG